MPKKSVESFPNTHINRTPEQRLPERIDVNVTKWYKIDVYNQLQANWERFADYMWTESQK